MKELQDEAADPKSILNIRGASRKEELLLLIRHLETALLEVDAIVQKYQSLSRRERRIWNQLKFATEHLDPIRDKLTIHLTSINLFTASLSRGSLAYIEKVLLELVGEVRLGRRPSIVPGTERDEPSVWKELECELAEDGISKDDVAKNKAAIKVFLLTRMNSTSADNVTLDEVASVIGSTDDPNIRPMTQDSRVSTIRSFYTATTEQYESANQELGGRSTSEPTISAPRISFAPQTRLPVRPKNPTAPNSGIDERLRYTPVRSTSTSSGERYRHSLDASIIDAKALEQNPKTPELIDIPQRKQMVLIIDPTHSSVSKLAHACLRSFVKDDPLVKAHIDTVRSTAWQEYENGGMDSLSLDKLIRELLVSKKIELPKWDKQLRFTAFRLRDIVEFDHIIYFNSPSFRQVLEEHIEKIAELKETYGTTGRALARLTRYDLLPSLITPESIEEDNWNKAVLNNRQRLALAEVFRKVQRFILRFLEEEFGLKRVGQGFEKVQPRRPSRSSPLPLSQEGLPDT